VSRHSWARFALRLIASLLVVYALGSIVAWTPDVGQWHACGRLIAVTVAMMAALAWHDLGERPWRV